MNKTIILIITFILVLISSISGALIDDQVSYWKFDVNDATPDDSHGTNHLTNYGATYDTTGFINSDYSYLINDYMLTGSATGRTKANSWTYSLWFKVDSLSTESLLMSDSVGSADRFGINLNAGELRTAVYNGAGYSGGAKSVAFSDTTSYHHICITYDGGTSLKAYLDNVEMTGTNPPNLGGNVGVNFGRNVDGNRYFSGNIDEIGFWLADKGSSGCTELWNSGSGNQYPFSSGSIDNNLSISLIYPTNNTIFYGDYTGFISFNLTNVNGSASCDINNTNWIENGTTYGNETVYFYNSNVTGNNQSLTINCSDLDQTKSIDFWFYQENVINLTFYNEETLEIMNGINITIDFISATGNTNGSTITGVYSSLYFPLGDMEINFKADGYAIRQNYFTLYPGKQYSIDLYLINESTSTQIFVELYDEFGKELEGYYVKTYRRIDGIYYNIETSKTNWDGKADFYGLLSTPMYYWVITNKAGEVLRMSGESEIYGTTLPFNIVLEEPTGRTFNKLGGLIYTLTFDNTTKKFIYNYHDTTYTSTASTLEVKTFPGGVVVGSNTSTAQAGILTVDMSSIFVNGTTYIAQTYINFSPAVYVSSISHTFPVTPFNMGSFGLFLTIIIIIGIAFAGLWNPAVMFILEGLAVFLTKAVELHHLSYVTCVTILCLCLISAYLVSDRT